MSSRLLKLTERFKRHLLLLGVGGRPASDRCVAGRGDIAHWMGRVALRDSVVRGADPDPFLCAKVAAQKRPGQAFQHC
ncbi:hypothetical protein KQH49_08940 [Mycetohabitans sp. B5]|uniref:hypothetical protein n=1 Tax=Mycetohabitans TaxID=2571159 RepID=UPI0011B009FB|nr:MULTISPECIES: hypothetical protein [Mycetohabitans]MCG1055067.1 hypothetical protein [Mycetohabitans sp. B5]